MRKRPHTTSQMMSRVRGNHSEVQSNSSSGNPDTGSPDGSSAGRGRPAFPSGPQDTQRDISEQGIGCSTPFLVWCLLSRHRGSSAFWKGRSRNWPVEPGWRDLQPVADPVGLGIDPSTRLNDTKRSLARSRGLTHILPDPSVVPDSEAGGTFSLHAR